MQKRKQVIVNPKVQLRLIVLIIIFAVLPVIGLLIGLMFYTTNLLQQIPEGNETLVQLISAIQKINLFTFTGFIFIIVLLAIVETQFLHRLVGPIYRIEMDLEEIIHSRNFSRQIQIRKEDYLHSLVTKINRILSFLAEK